MSESPAAPPPRQQASEKRMLGSTWIGLLATLAVLLMVFLPDKIQPPAKSSEVSAPPPQTRVIPLPTPASEAASRQPEAKTWAEFFAPQTSPARKQRLWEEALGGSNEEKLELALQILAAPPSPWTDPARDLLQLYLGEDLGEDPALWREAVQARQKKLALDKSRVLEKLQEHRARFR